MRTDEEKKQVIKQRKGDNNHKKSKMRANKKNNINEYGLTTIP